MKDKIEKYIKTLERYCERLDLSDIDQAIRWCKAKVWICNLKKELKKYENNNS